ncbi:MAG: GWxTD domain-containing protein [Bacteroidetes bacterium]|nr:GWxTD domain-containing protein [Bacteroidota bacterium]
MNFLKKYFSLLSPALFAVIIFFPGATSCHYPSTSATKQNYADFYQPKKVFRPSYVLYNVSDSLTRMYFSVPSKDLLYTKNLNDINYTAHILISYEVHPLLYPKAVVDSGSVVMSDVGGGNDDKILMEGVDMDVYAKDNFFVEVNFRDLNKATTAYDILYLDHSDKNSSNNFYLALPEQEAPLFHSWATKGSSYDLHYYNRNTPKIYVRHYANATGPALPPYSYQKQNFIFQPDSSWTVDNVGECKFTFSKEGFYFFSAQPETNNGYTISVFNSGFPEVTVAKELLYPLRYLTMRDEYMKMDTAVNTKKAVDEFWLNCTGSEERAREVIRNFYNRVGAANDLFTVEREGWKSDRGMIYLIFGPPGNVYRTSGTETWLYGNETGMGNLTFVFDHSTTNTFSNCDFELERNEVFKSAWISAVDSWRQGHVFNMK